MIWFLICIPTMQFFGYSNWTLGLGTRVICRIPDYPRYPTRPYISWIFTTLQLHMHLYNNALSGYQWISVGRSYEFCQNYRGWKKVFSSWTFHRFIMIRFHLSMSDGMPWLATSLGLLIFFCPQTTQQISFHYRILSLFCNLGRSRLPFFFLTLLTRSVNRVFAITSAL